MAIHDGLDIPAELAEFIDFSPLEDFMVRILRPVFESAGVDVFALVPDEPKLPLIVPRRLSSFGTWGGDARGLLDKSRLAIHVYTMDPNGDQKGALYSEIVRGVLQRASDEHWSDPEIGVITKITMTEAPVRVSDWATSQGPVQYADLPVGAYRHETHYSVLTRPPSVL